MDVRGSWEINMNTPLIIATEKGHHEIVRALLEHKASLELQNGNGQTAAMIAKKLAENAIATLKVFSPKDCDCNC